MRCGNAQTTVQGVGYDNVITDAQGNEVINLTAILLTLCLVALSFIIMSICSYIISVINKIAIVRSINKTKEEIGAIDGVEQYIEPENEY